MTALKLLPAFAVLALAACETAPPPPPAPTRPPARVFEGDLQGAAQRCEVQAPAVLSTTAANQARMTVRNEGGWCGLPLSRSAQPNEPAPFAAGLLTTRPTHGRVGIKTVGDVTRVDYTPDPGYAGPDSFVVKLLPGNPEVQVAVVVEPPPPPPAPPPSAAPAPAPAPQRTPARPATQRR